MQVKNLVAPTAAASRLGISTSRKLVRDGHIVFVHIGRGEAHAALMYRRIDIREFIENRRSQGPSPARTMGRKLGAYTGPIINFGDELARLRAARRAAERTAAQ